MGTNINILIYKENIVLVFRLVFSQGCKSRGQLIIPLYDFYLVGKNRYILIKYVMAYTQNLRVNQIAFNHI